MEKEPRKKINIESYLEEKTKNLEGPKVLGNVYADQETLEKHHKSVGNVTTKLGDLIGDDIRSQLPPEPEEEKKEPTVTEVTDLDIDDEPEKENLDVEKFEENADEYFKIGASDFLSHGNLAVIPEKFITDGYNLKENDERTSDIDFRIEVKYKSAEIVENSPRRPL